MTELLKTPEAAKRLGVSITTLWRMTRSGAIPTSCYITCGEKRPRCYYDLEALMAHMRKTA